jgi:photosystem II stability/assembly factor-like uncharacterized protein
MTFLYWLVYLCISLFPGQETKPNDWFYAQRAFPYDTIPTSYYHRTITSLSKSLQSTKRNSQQEWTFAGPTNIGGRITDIQSDPQNPSLIYIAAANGGVFRSNDAGNAWSPIFDQNGIGSIGSLALQDRKPNTLYVGTGEANGGGGSVAYDGKGIFRTEDGGTSWKYLGLELSGSIPKIIIHPTNPNIIYAAAMGKLFGKNTQRGVYKSTDFGASWQQVFFHSDSVGVIDLQIDPRHPDTLYAATWERSRKPSGIDYGGAECNVYRSFDGGKIWVKLTNGLPTGSDKGRIGIAVAPSDPRRVFAFYVDESGDFLGVYRSDNYGDEWTKLNGRINASSFGWWFGKIYVDPKNADIVYGLGFSAAKSTDGGNQFYPITELTNLDIHVDQHALYINPNNTNQLLLGNDGGLYSSQDGGSNWAYINNLPITQFYTCHVDYSLHSRLYGGTQDNSCIRTISGNVNQWEVISGGDGFVCLVDPLDNNYVYTESQYGFFAKSTNGGNSFFYALNGIDGSDRKNWNTPVIFHPKTPSTLFLGTNKLYKSVDRAQNWTAISPSLAPENNTASFGTITTIAVSPIDPNIIYCGTDVGKVWRTLNGGINWEEIGAGLPVRWITSVHASSRQKNKVYLTISGYRYNESLSHVYVSLDNGNNWNDISRGLPPVPCNKIIEDPVTSGHLILATDAGVWRSFTDGQTWESLGNGLPLMVISDLYFHLPTRKLVAATYGRGLYTYSLELPSAINQDASPLFSFKAYPNPTHDFIEMEYTSSNPLDLISVTLHDLEGNTLLTALKNRRLSTHWKEVLDLTQYPPGIYIMTWNTKRGSQSNKILKY